MKNNINLKKAQKINMILLEEIDRVCKKYNITYYYDAGGLLGAIRHQSFIPWDDDVDIAMTRKDYEKLRKIAKTEWKNSDFLFVDYHEFGNNMMLDFITRLIYLKEKIPVNTFDKVKNKARKDIYNCIALDIFVLDSLPNEKKKCAKTFNKQLFIYGLMMGHRAYINYSEYESIKIKLSIYLLSHIGRFLSVNTIYNLHENISQKYNSENSRWYYYSNYPFKYLGKRYKKSWYRKTVKVNINNKTLNAPCDWHYVLKTTYGDYMKLPPIKDRKPQHIIETSKK